MSRFDVIRRELEAYLAELDAERERVRAFLHGAGSVLAATDGDDTAVGANQTNTRASHSAPQEVTRERAGGDTAYALSLMTERRDVESWDTAALLATLTENDWDTNATNRLNAVSAILSRLARAGHLQRVGRGRYAVPRPENAESPTAEAVGLSDKLDLTPEGGEYTDGQGSHHDHREDLAGRDDDRDHLGAPVGH